MGFWDALGTAAGKAVKKWTTPIKKLTNGKIDFKVKVSMN